MLTIQEIQNHLTKVTYKPGWSFEAYTGRWEYNHIIIRTEVPDAETPENTVTLDIHSMLPPMSDTHQFDQWLMWRLARIEIHEMREFYKIEGKVVDSPHNLHAEHDL